MKPIAAGHIGDAIHRREIDPYRALLDWPNALNRQPQRRHVAGFSPLNGRAKQRFSLALEDRLKLFSAARDLHKPPPRLLGLVPFDGACP